MPAGPGEVWTGDLQAVVSVADGPTTVAITPHDARDLGPLPDGLFADGNAYEVVLGTDVAGELVLAVPHSATGLALSPDGETWDVVSVRTPEPLRVSVELTGSGWYLAVAEHEMGPADGGVPLDGAAVAVVLGAPLLLATLLVLARRRRVGPGA